MGVVAAAPIVMDEGALLAQRAVLNFIGASVSAADNPGAGRTDITVTAGGSGTYPGSTIAPIGGTSDDTAALQAKLNAIAAAGGGELIIIGKLRIASRCYYDGPPITIRGLSRTTCGFISTTATGDILELGNDTSTSYAGRHTVSELQFTSSLTKTGGAGLILSAGGSESRVENCQFLSLYDGIILKLGNQQARIVGCDMFTFARDAIRVDLNSTGQAGGYGAEYWITENAIYGAAGAGIRHIRTDAGHVTGNSIVACGKGLLFEPNANRSPENGITIVMANIFSDNVLHGVYVDGSTYQISKVDLIGNVSCYNGFGLEVIGANANSIRWQGGHIIANTGGFGAKIGAACPNVAIENAVIAGNTNCGIETVSGATGFKIAANRITNGNLGGGGAANGQAHGIKYGGSHDNYIVALNDLRGNATAATTGTPGGSNTVVANNLT